jgi:CO/xanthine dehydrogenase FAD-binding subunit
MKAERGFTDSISSEHLSSLSPIDDVRATAGYRRDAALTLIKRAFEACLEDR